MRCDTCLQEKCVCQHYTFEIDQAFGVSRLKLCNSNACSGTFERKTETIGSVEDSPIRGSIKGGETSMISYWECNVCHRKITDLPMVPLLGFFDVEIYDSKGNFIGNKKMVYRDDISDTIAAMISEWESADCAGDW